MLINRYRSIEGIRSDRAKFLSGTWLSKNGIFWCIKFCRASGDCNREWLEKRDTTSKLWKLVERVREARVEEESRRAHESANPISTRDIPHPPTAGGGCFEALMIISNINRKYCLINVTCLRWSSRRNSRVTETRIRWVFKAERERCLIRRTETKRKW